MFLGFLIAAINFNGIAHRLKSVEGKPYRKYNPKEREMGINIKGVKDCGNIFNEEVVIFKIA